MKDKNLEINGLFVAGIIIIVSFVFAINLQPVVFGTDTTFFLKNDNCSYDLMPFKSYKEFSCFNYNYSTSPGLLLKRNKEIIEDSDFTLQSADIYKLSFENSFGYQGRVMQIEHEESTQENEYYYWYGWSSCNVERSLFINDVFYTISNKLIKMNDLGDFNKINSIELQ